MKLRKNIVTNSDYDRLNDLVHSRLGRIIYGSLAERLGQELYDSEVVSPTLIPKSVVTMNSKVRIRDVKLDECETYTLVYPQDANINEGKLSVLAPLGTALLGAFVGDVVEVKVPAGTRNIRLERIQYQPEAAGDYHL